MSDILDAEGWRFERLDGSVSGTERQKAIDRFSDKNSDSFIFILSTRAGGVGINLTAADTVIVFDPDWNPQNDVQAMARVHRIGQTKTVQIYKLCTKGTYENHMLKLANQKLGLEHAVMRTGEHTNRELTATGFAKQDRTHDVESVAQRASQIEQLLKSGAKLLLSSEQDSNAAAFGQSSIEEILEHYSETTAVEGADGAEGAEGGEGGAGGGGGVGASGHVKKRAKSTFSQAGPRPDPALTLL